jgi:hypothetical protein
VERARQALGPNPLRRDALATRFEALERALAQATEARRAEGRIPKAD